jgi:hypothetical protein
VTTIAIATWQHTAQGKETKATSRLRCKTRKE